MPSPLKAVILTNTFLPTIGGVQYELKWFLDNLDRRLEGDDAVEVHFIYPDDDVESEKFACFRNIFTYRLSFQAPNKLRLFSGIVRLGRLLRKIDPDIIHCYSGLLPEGLWTVLAHRLFRLRAKIVVTSHGSDTVWLPEISYGTRNSPKARRTMKRVARRIDRHVLVGHAMIEHAVDAGSPRSNICVIPNGIPQEGEYDFELELVQDTRSFQGGTGISNSNGGITILSLSSGRPLKNLDALVEGFHLAKSELGDSKLLLGCVGPTANRIEGLVAERELGEQVHFIGEVTGRTKHDYFLTSDVYCLPSHFESFGIVALEAMKFGTAVVATNTGGITDFVEHGKNGLLVSPWDVQGFASALVEMYRNPVLRMRLVANGLDTIMRFSMSRIIDHYISLYEDLVSQ